MRITSVTLQNVGVFKSYHTEFGSGLIGITGPNGAGKTTLVNSIYAALTNDFTRLAPTKADAITKGSEGNSFIQVSGTHYNVEFTITRWLRPSKQELVVGDKRYTASADINKFIEESLNATKATIDNYIFVDQWEMFNFINQNISERAKLFQHLCGIAIASDIYKVCSDFLLKNKNVEIIDNSLELAAEIKNLKTSWATLDEKSRSLEERLLDKEKVKEYRAVISQFERLNGYKNELVKLQTNLMEQEAEQKTEQEEMEDLNSAISKQEDKLEKRKNKTLKSQEVIRQYESQQSKIEALNKHKQELERAEGGLAKLVYPKLPKEYILAAERNKHFNQEGELLHQIKAYRKLAEHDESECPFCLQPIPEKLRANYKETYDELCIKHNKLTEATRVSDKYDHEKDQVTVAETYFKNDIAKHITKIEALESVIDEQADHGTYLKAKEFLSVGLELKAKLRKNVDELQSLSTSLAVGKSEIKSLQEDIKAIKQKIDACPSFQSYDESKLRLVQYQAKLDEFNVISGRMDEIVNQYKVLKKTYKNLQEQLEKKKKINNMIATVERVKDIFHWGALPKSVAQSNLKLLVDDINELLVMFSNPFYVEADQDLSFQVYFPGKEPVSAKQLSGGQKVILAIAFRAALDKVFGNNIGMLFLDEPTSGLDADNVKYFHETLKQLAVGDDRQLIMITHVHDFSDAFDQMISVGNP